MVEDYFKGLLSAPFKADITDDFLLFIVSFFVHFICRSLFFILEERILLTMKRTENEEIIKYNQTPEINFSFENTPQVFPAHWHMSAEIILIKKDRAHYSINSQDFTAEEGDILLIWPADLHATIDAPTGSSLILQFSSGMLNTCHDIGVHYRFIRTFHLLKAADEPALCGRLKEMLEESYHLFIEPETFSETMIRIRILSMLLMIAEYAVQNYPYGEPSSALANNETMIRMRNACTYIEQNCDRDISQAEVAEYLGLSHYYFSRMFRKYTSTSFRDYLARQRIERAIKYLADKNMSITDAAYQSGFQSISNFNQVFRRIMNCSPSDYRGLYSRETVVTDSASHAGM